MTLWLILALMTVAAIAAVIWPLLRHGVATRSGSDVVVYRDQLDEVGRDLAAGLIGKTEAGAARVEISRRLLAAADTAKNNPAPPDSTPMAWRRWAIAGISLMLLPVGAAGLYLRLGSPGLASEPLAARMEAPAQGQDQAIGKLLVQVEEHLQSNPKDGRGWEVLAPVYMQLGRYGDAVNAWRNAIRFLGDNADRQADLGEALTAAANGIVTDEAKAAFVRSATLDGTTVTARYYLGLAAEQDGKRDKAVKIWRELIADAPPGVNWVATVRTALARVEGKEDKAVTALPGPTPAEMLAAAKQPPAQQDTMIKEMVARLSERLKKDGSDVKGWEQLVRSYKVLGDTDKRKAAVADAKKALEGDADKLKQFDMALKDIESGTTGAAPARAEAPAAPPLPSPTPAPTQVAAEKPPAQDSMISGMVGRLVERLKKDGSDLNGWVMLVRSYKVMGEPDKANAAAAEARRIFANDPEKMKQLEAGLKTTDASAGPGPAAPASPPPQQKGAQNAAPNSTAQHEGEQINAMVEKLAAKLKKSGDNPEGWLMLTRSYLTLKQNDKAKAAIKDARKALSADPEKLQMFEAALKQFKIEAPQ